MNNLGKGGSLLPGESPKNLHCAKIGCLHLTVWILELSKSVNIPPHVFTGHEGLPLGYWYNLLYGTGVLLFCLIVCLVGASEFKCLSILLSHLVIFSLSSLCSDSVIQRCNCLCLVV